MSLDRDRRRVAAAVVASAAIAFIGTGRAAATPLVDTVAARLLHPAVLRGRFEQDKRIAGFKQALHSRGEFLLAAGQGVIWTTREPFAAELRLSRDALVGTQDGTVVMSLDASREPGLRAINQLLFALLAGDLATLAQQFRVDGAVAAEHWSLDLVPLDPGMARVLSRIRLGGDTLVRTVELDEANGDHTSLRFLELGSTPAALTPAEQAKFRDVGR